MKKEISKVLEYESQKQRKENQTAEEYSPAAFFSFAFGCMLI